MLKKLKYFSNLSFFSLSDNTGANRPFNLVRTYRNKYKEHLIKVALN